MKERKSVVQNTKKDEKNVEKSTTKKEKIITKKEIENDTKNSNSKKSNLSAKVEVSTKSSKSKKTNAKIDKEAKKSSVKKMTKEDTKKTNSSSVSSEKVSIKKVPNKNKTTKKAAIRKITTKKTSTLEKTKKIEFTTVANEYFDLPYRYNETLVKLLAQTPNKLFVYWDISDSDRKNYITEFGENFFYDTTPYLRIKNQTKNYTFDIEIDDFANSWYININDDDCKYLIELYRKYKPNTTPTTLNTSIVNYNLDYIYITSSNTIDAPNGKIISTKFPRTITYKNIKTNKLSYKVIDKYDFKFFNTFYKNMNIRTEILKDNPTSRY